MPIPKLKNLKLNRALIFFDIESTGINPSSDRIVELCIVKYPPNIGSDTQLKLGQGAELSEPLLYNYRFNPSIPIPHGASAVHGIYDHDVADKPYFTERAEEIYEIFRDSDVSGYNAIRYDVPHLVEELVRAGMPSPFDERTRYLDPQVIFHKQEKRDLTAAYKFYCDEDLRDAHSAEADVIATISVLDAQLSRYNLDTDINYLSKFCTDDRGRNRVDFEGQFLRDERGEIVFGKGKHKGTRAASNHGYLKWMLNAEYYSPYTKYIIEQIMDGKLS